MIHKKIIIFLAIIFFGLFGWAGKSLATTTYYIDWGNGADTNNGTSKTTPWKHAPGMRGCSDNCAAYQTTNWDANGTATAGNQFIFKGGVTWPAAALSWDWIYGSGTQTSPIYFGAGDKSWYNGSSWTRPMFDAEKTNPTSPYFSGIFRAYGNWFIIDNIEFKGLAQLNNNYPGPGMLSVTAPSSVSTAAEIKNCYFHGWSHGGTATNDYLKVIDTPYMSSTDTNLFIHDNYIDGSDTTKDMGIGISGSAGHIYNNYLGYLPNAIINLYGRYYWGNTFDQVGHTFSFEAAAHHNTIYNVHGTIYIWNNYILNSGGGGDLILGQDANQTLFIFNNVIAGDYNDQPLQLYNAYWGTTQTETKDYVFGNTINSFGSGYISFGSDTSYPGLKYGYAHNNHLMGTSPLINWQLTKNKVETNNSVMTNSAATAAGYVMGSTYPFIAPNGSGATVNAGADLSSICGLMTNSAISSPATDCLSDSTVGVSTDPATHKVIYPKRAAVARGSAWDIGAYEYTGSAPADTTPPATPTGLAVQ